MCWQRTSVPLLSDWSQTGRGQSGTSQSGTGPPGRGTPLTSRPGSRVCFSCAFCRNAFHVVGFCTSTHYEGNPSATQLPSDLCGGKTPLPVCSVTIRCFIIFGGGRSDWLRTTYMYNPVRSVLIRVSVISRRRKHSRKRLRMRNSSFSSWIVRGSHRGWAVLTYEAALGKPSACALRACVSL